MMLYDNRDPRVATGRLFSTMMVTIILLTTLALISSAHNRATRKFSAVAHLRRRISPRSNTQTPNQ